MTGLPAIKGSEPTPLIIRPKWSPYDKKHRHHTHRIIDIHQFRRPDTSVSESAFISKFIIPLGVSSDKYGNLYKVIGKEPKILWSCHTDTVHNKAGIQQVSIWGQKKLKLASAEEHSSCLGADDGAGVWMLIELIKAKVPGLYVFHRNEEHGCKGSKFVLDHHRDVITDLKAAIAFDRRGTRDIITHQCSVRTCSDAFAEAVAEGLGMGHCPDDGGAFTDTETYRSVIPECTNIAAGYDGAHGKGESLDLEYLINLRSAALALKWDKLPIVRDPTKYERKSYYYGGYKKGEHLAPGATSYPGHAGPQGWENDYMGHEFDKYTPPSSSKEPTTILEYIKQKPEVVADLLEQWGMSVKDIKDYVEAANNPLPAPADPAQTG